MNPAVREARLFQVADVGEQLPLQLWRGEVSDVAAGGENGQAGGAEGGPQPGNVTGAQEEIVAVHDDAGVLMRAQRFCIGPKVVLAGEVRCGDATLFVVGQGEFQIVVAVGEVVDFPIACFAVPALEPATPPLAVPGPRSG